MVPITHKPKIEISSRVGLGGFNAKIAREYTQFGGMPLPLRELACMLIHQGRGIDMFLEQHNSEPCLALCINSKILEQ